MVCRSAHRAGVFSLGLLVATLGFVQPASAALIEQDLFTSGDGLITLDTSTGLEWLDVTETLGQTYNAVAAGRRRAIAKRCRDPRDHRSARRIRGRANGSLPDKALRAHLSFR